MNQAEQPDQVLAHRVEVAQLEVSQTAPHPFSVVLQKIAILLFQLLLTLPMGLGLAKLHIGGTAWILSGVAAGVLVLQVYRLRFQTASPNASVRKIGQTLVGMMIGFAIANGDLSDVVTHLPVFVLLTLILLLSGGAIGYLFAQLSQINLLTAILATVPGGIAIMSSIAADYDRDVPLVSLVQGIRITSVVILIPFVARALAGDSSSTIAPQTWLSLDAAGWGWLVVATGLAGLGAILATRLKVPSPPFFGSLLLGAVFNPALTLLLATDFRFHPPAFINVLGQSLLGITIGEYWGNKPSIQKRAIVAALLCVGLTILAALFASLVALQITHWDWLTCLLVTAPGGAAEMILVALTLNHSVETVTAGHLVRLIAINTLLPFWVASLQADPRQMERL
ncbi:AbrB family transcriptional regulator [Phormidium tenue FACHB-886]|nr:AbrB family transcriptional regulator [Phormidium tenue FACHB-886]